MKFNYYVLLVAALISITACQPDGNRTPTGYDYTVVAEGTGEPAKAKDYVVFSIKITGEDGKVLQEVTDGQNMPTVQIPGEGDPVEKPNPISDILAVGKKGGIYTFQMPIDSIPNAPADIQSMKYIVYEIGIMEILNEEQYKVYQEKQQADMQAKIADNMVKLATLEQMTKTTISDYKSGKLVPKTTESGLKYHIVEPGEGANPAVGNTVSVNYYGVLTDGTRFDDSFQRGSVFSFALGTGQVIKGWDEGIALLNKGAKAYFFIPASLGYGEAGSPPVIPENAELVFYVELEDFK
jgi:FKBP-type peptidyl-prolyl cis-trans isomerase FkpA